MASVQSKYTKPEIPPKLTNISSVCYCNALFQCLFNNDDIWNTIQDINEHDQLKKISNSFYEASGRYHGINLLPLYQTFRPFINIRNADSGHSQHDPSEFLAAIINEYHHLKPIVSSQGSVEHGLDSFITIDPNIENIQEGLSMRINMKNGEFVSAPPLLCIKIERISARGINMKSIEINNSLIFNAVQEDGSQLSDKYALESILCHRNTNPRCGHFIAIVKKSDKFFYCDDSTILDGIPQNSSLNSIKTKSYMLFYRKTENETSQEDFFSIKQASRNGTTKRRESYTKETISEMTKTSYGQTSLYSASSSLDPEHQIRRIPQIQFPVTSKEQKKTKPIAIELNGELGMKEISKSPIENIDIKDCKEENHDCIQRINLHEEFKYIYGYLDINRNETIDGDYIPDDPIYTKHAALLEKFVSIICDFVFVISADNGLINANTTAEVLGVNRVNALQEQVKIIGDEIVNYYQACLALKDQPKENVIEQNLAKILRQYIVFKNKSQDNKDKDDFNDEVLEPQSKHSRRKLINEEEMLLTAPDENYKWQERVDVLGLVEILDQIKERHQKVTKSDDNKIMNLRRKFWNDYLSKREEFKTDKAYVQDWCKNRNDFATNGELKFTESTGLKLLSMLKSNEGTLEVKKRTGIAAKITDESRLCLLATIMDFPYLTDKERANYLNRYGPNVTNNVTEKTVNNELNNLKLYIKNPAFSIKERNTFGYLIARYLWGYVIDSIMQNKKVIPCFIDEAGVKKSPAKNARAYLSVAPIVAGEHAQHNVATILTAIVPGFGNFSRWFEGSVTHNEYAQFIREAAFIIRTKICKDDNQLVFINDNAAIHKVDVVRKIAAENRINLIYTVPYSPQTNLPAENYFSRMKQACIFDHFIYTDDETAAYEAKNFDMNRKPKEETIIKKSSSVEKEDEKEKINGTSYKYILLNSIIKRWDFFNKIKYSSESSMKIYNAWERVVEDCKNGKELTGQHYKIRKDSLNKISCSCLRK